MLKTALQMATGHKTYVYCQLNPTAVILQFSFLNEYLSLSILIHPLVTTWYFDILQVGDSGRGEGQLSSLSLSSRVPPKKE